MTGLAFLVSAALRRPLTFYAYRRTAGPRPVQDELDALWAAGPGFRRPFLVAAWVWGAGLTGEALLRLALVPVVPVDVMVGLSTAMNVAVLAGITLWTVRYRRRFEPSDEAAPAFVQALFQRGD